MKHSIELQPFMVPNFVRQAMAPRPRQEGFVETPAIPLSDLSAETLGSLCDSFRDAVFEKAGKEDMKKCTRPDGCVCGGDVPAVRRGCSYWGRRA